MQRSIAGEHKRGPKAGRAARFKERVLAIVAAIPAGRVTTYGDIGKHLKATGRQVAYILARFTAEESVRLPWFRVVAANGVISSLKLGAVGRKQIERLRVEGVLVTARSKVVDFAEIVWLPD
jgi:methylated-DNA-protein-cysteine methyltransferase related protein